MTGSVGSVHFLGLVVDSLGLRGSEDAERDQMKGKQVGKTQVFIHTERAWLGDLLRAWDGEGPLLLGRTGEGTLGAGPLFDITGEETCRRDTSPRFGDPTRLGFVGRQGDAGLFEPSTLLLPTRELFGDMLFFLVYLAGMPRTRDSLCSWSGDGRRGGVNRLVLELCWGDVGGERGRGY